MPPNLEELKRQETASRLSQSDRASRLADTHGPAHLQADYELALKFTGSESYKKIILQIGITAVSTSFFHNTKEHCTQHLIFLSYNARG
jgi:hypothetical protein